MHTVVRGVALAAIALFSALSQTASHDLRSPDGRRAAPGPAGAGCPPLAPGFDSFPSTATLVIDDSGFGEPFVVRLSSAGHPEAVVQRAGQVGDTIDTELLQMELSGFHPRVGAITVRESASQPSLGQIAGVVLDGSCELAGGQAFFDLFVDIELPGLGETWIHQLPVRVEAGLSSLPPVDVVFEVPLVNPITLRDQGTNAERGTLFYALHHADPPFPPPGPDCFDSLLTADLELFGPGMTAGLIGFGPTTVNRGPMIPGGTCKASGLPCQDDFDCLLLDSCRRDAIDTEIVQMDLAGFDILLGNWSIAVRPGLGTSNCCEANGSPGCSDPLCESLICTMDNFCCDVEWDLLCAQLAQGEPTCFDNCLDPNANPTLGTVESVNLDRTYPATSGFDVFVRIETDLQGSLHNAVPIPVEPPSPITNLPPDPQTQYLYGSPPIPILDDGDNPVGQISNVVHTVDIPKDCGPPPAAGEDCFDSRVRVELTLPPCPAEQLLLTGHFRVLRDDPVPGVGFGQERIDTVMAKAEFTGTGACVGPLTVRLSPTLASGGAASSLAAEEFFPADSFFDLQLEIDTGIGTLTVGPSHMATSINALPPDADEIYFGPGTVIDLLDGTGTKVGEILEVSHEILALIECPADCDSAIVFTGPTKADFSVAVPGGGVGLEYDVVRGDLGSLRSGGGTFSTAACLLTNVGPLVSDAAEPASGDAFYYLSRDGLGSFNGTWNGSGAAQQGDRDPKLPDCQ